jgi:hypothetical protein
LLKEKAVSTKIYLSLGSWALKFSFAMGNAFGVIDGTADAELGSVFGLSRTAILTKVHKYSLQQGHIPNAFPRSEKTAIFYTTTLPGTKKAPCGALRLRLG